MASYRHSQNRHIHTRSNRLAWECSHEINRSVVAKRINQSLPLKSAGWLHQRDTSSGLRKPNNFGQGAIARCRRVSDKDVTGRTIAKGARQRTTIRKVCTS